MRDAFRQSMAWLHTWSGLVIGWALYMMFLAGTAAVFKDETSMWMRPEIPHTADPAAALDLAQRRLEHVAPHAQRWQITLPDERDSTTQISWVPRDVSPDASTANTRETLDSSTGQPLHIRETRGGDLFYRLHYRFEIQGRNGWWLSGAAAVVMLIAIVCGVIIHKRFFKDFFTFRSRSAPQRAWLDAHNLLAVTLLPFHFIITYTGLVPIMSTVMPWAIAANYADTPLTVFTDYDQVRSAYSQDLRTDELRRKPSGESAALVSLSSVRAQAERRWGGVSAGRVSVANPFDRNALVEVSRHDRGQVSNRSERLLFDGVTGAYVGASKPISAVNRVSAFMYGLHMVRFADTPLRWIVFVVGLASSLMIACGLVLWVVKRTPAKRGADDRVPFGYAFVARLNVAGVIGLPIAMAGLFWANRLLPVDMAQRAAAETRVFFFVWLASLVLAFARPRKAIWVEQLWAAAFAFGALPLLNAATTDKHLLATVREGDWLRAGFDLTMLGCALMFAFAAVKLRRAQRNDVTVQDRRVALTELQEEGA